MALAWHPRPARASHGTCAAGSPQRRSCMLERRLIDHYHQAARDLRLITLVPEINFTFLGMSMDSQSALRSQAHAMTFPDLLRSPLLRVLRSPNMGTTPSPWEYGVMNDVDYDVQRLKGSLLKGFP